MVVFIVVGSLKLPIIVVGIMLFLIYLIYLVNVFQRGKQTRNLAQSNLAQSSQNVDAHLLVSMENIYINQELEGVRHLRKSRIESIFENESVKISY